VTCVQCFASEDLKGGQNFAFEGLKRSRLTRAPDSLPGGHHQSQHHWSESFSRQQP
jgi:hypothetical protein